MADYLVGCNVRTSGTKAVVTNEEGKVLGSRYIEYHLITPIPGWRLFELPGNPIDPQYVTARLMWEKNNRPEFTRGHRGIYPKILDLSLKIGNVFLI
jgi:hypothetical protein